MTLGMIVALLLLGAVLEDAGGVHARHEHERRREAHRADVLEAEGQGEQAAVVAAVLLRHQRAEQADVGELLPQLVVELVVAMRHLAPLLLLVLVAGEHLADGAAEQLVFFGDLEFQWHRSVSVLSAVVGGCASADVSIPLILSTYDSRAASYLLTVRNCSALHAPVAVLLVHDVDGVVFADGAAVFAVAAEAGVEVHLWSSLLWRMLRRSHWLWCQPAAAMRSNRSAGAPPGLRGCGSCRWRCGRRGS